MRERKLTAFYVIFFLTAVVTVSLIVFEKPIRTITRATGSSVSSKKSVVVVDMLQAPVPKGTVTISVFARNAQGEALVGKTVTAKASTGELTPSSRTSGENGKAVFLLRSSKQGNSTVTAAIDGVDVGNTITVYFR